MIHYFSSKYAIKVHNTIIENSGGLSGYKDIGMLDSVLEHIKNDIYYPDFLDKITHLVYSINKNHAFNDGNKRASIALSCYFLEINAHEYAIKQYTHGMEEVAVWLASSLIEKVQLKSVIEFLLYDDSTLIYSFILKSRNLRPYIERDDGSLIDSDLLDSIINDLMDSGSYSDGINAELLNITSQYLV